MPFEIPINMNSVMLVRDELNKSLANTVHCAEDFLSEPSDAERRDRLIAELQQVTGILRVLEFAGALELSVSLLKLVQATAEEKLVLNEQVAACLIEACRLLQRYIEYCSAKRCAYPLAVSTALHELRLFARQVPLYEAQQIGFQPTQLPDPEMPSAGDLSTEELVRSKRLHHMYQAGLLAVLQGRNVPANMRLMAHALARLQRECKLLASGEWWLLSRAFLESVINGHLRLTRTRRRLLAFIDGYLRMRLKDGDRPPIALSDEHRCELVCLVMLAAGPAEVVDQIKALYNLDPTAFTDNRLAEIEAQLAGPGSAALNAVAQALREELYQIKEVLDTQHADINASTAIQVSGHLRKLGEILGMTGFNRLKGMLVDIDHLLVESADQSGIVDSSAISTLAEILLMVENTLSDPENFSDQALDGEGRATVMLGQAMLDEAIGVVLNESKSAISMAKRGITAYLESSYDSDHVANVGAALEMVRGTFEILGHDRAARVLKQCIRFIASCDGSQVEQESFRQTIETFADALIGIEYYLDDLSVSDRENSQLIAIAEESITELGYAA